MVWCLKSDYTVKTLKLKFSLNTDKKELSAYIKDSVDRELLKMFQPRYAPLGRSFSVFGVRSYEDTCYFCRKKGMDMDTMVLSIPSYVFCGHL